jgi:carbamoyl-phosphate synthase large subunit
MKEFNVLFLGGAKRVSFAEYLKRATESRGFSFNLTSYELEKEVPIAVVGDVVIGLRWKDPNLYSHLCEVIRSKNIQMVLPFVDPAIRVASELKTLMPHVYIPCSSAEMCDIMFDKQLSATWFESQGVAVPRTCRHGDDPFFPLIAKPRRGSASKGIEVIRDPDELTRFAKNHEVGDFVLQQFVENGEEFTVDAFVSQDQRIISVVPRIRLETAGGEAVRSITLHDRIVEELAMNVLQTKAFSGPVTIQCIRDRQSGETFVMEINPRYGGAVIASFAAGADTTACLVDEWSKRPVHPLLQWEENVLMTRYFKEVIFHATHN